MELRFRAAVGSLSTQSSGRRTRKLMILERVRVRVRVMVRGF